jgi:hypothetical protein
MRRSTVQTGPQPTRICAEAYRCVGEYPPKSAAARHELAPLATS